MPLPAEYQRATDHFSAFLTDLSDAAGFLSRHPAYTMAQGVLQVFRRRLPLRDAIRFAQLLPVGLRALFVADWNVDEPQRPWADRAALADEVRSLRFNHNFAPDDAVQLTARVLRQHVDGAALDALLRELGPEACAFWAP